APLRGRETEDIGREDRDSKEVRQDRQQQRQAPVEQIAAVEAQIERSKERQRRREHVVHGDQQVAQGEMRETRHSTTTKWKIYETFDNVPAMLIAYLARPCQRRPFRNRGAAASPAERALSTIPPATPTPSTYIQPSWKSKMCELNTELKTFCTT